MPDWLPAVLIVLVTLAVTVVAALDDAKKLPPTQGREGPK